MSSDALRECRILNTAPEPAFDAIVARAARAARAPFALLVLRDGERLWFKAAHGARADAAQVDPLAQATMQGEGVLWVSDLTRSKRDAHNPWVTGPPFIRAYAGVPLKIADDHVVGFLCVIDVAPRRRSLRVVRELEELGAIASALIDARRQVTLRAESERLRALAEKEAGVGFWRIDRDTKEGWWSPGVYSIFGRDPSLGPAMPRDYKPLAPDGAWEGWKEFIRRATTTRDSFTLQLPLKAPNGPLRRVKIVCAADKDATNISHGIVIDETAMLEAIEKVQAHERLLSSFIDDAPAALAMLDREMRYIRASPRWRSDYGLGEADLEGRRHYDVFPEIGEDWKAVHQRCLAGAVERRARDLFVRADGSRQYLAWEVRPWRDAAGEIGGLMMMTHDLTQEVETVLALEATSARLLQALEIGRAFMWEYEDESARIQVNGNPAAVMGFPMPTASSAIEVFAIVHPDDRDAAIAAWKDHVKSGVPYRLEQRTNTPDGSERWVLAVSEAKRRADGHVIGAIGLIQDITARKRAEHALAAARDAAEAANASKSQFLATISHEIRTPLNGVLGMAHALTRSQLSDEQRRLLGAIVDSGDSLVCLLNDLLDEARIEAGQLALAEAPFHLKQTIDNAVALNRVRAEAKGLQLLVHGDLAGAYVGDPLRIKQVLLNLLSNAVKFTEHGSVRVLATRCDAGDGRDVVTIRVADTGIGFDAATRERLFQRFVQADAQTTRRFGGTGLGLSISRGLVELMGGEIDCRSAPRRGAEFWFTLRLKRVSEARTPEQTPAAGEALGLRVLCAEDHPINRKVVELMLGSAGCTTSFAENGQEAVDLWELGVFDLVIMDVHMPVMSGEAAARAIREREAVLGRARTPILALTANATEQHAAACLAAGMDGHVAKPVRPETLLTAIRHAIAHASALQQESQQEREA